MYPPEVIKALESSLRNVYWYKKDLRLFLRACEIPHNIITKQAWDDPQEYKYKIVDNILEELISMEDKGLGHIRCLISKILEIQSLDHLRNLEDGAKKVSEARISIEKLRELVLKHDSNLIKEKERQKEQQRTNIKSARSDEETNRLQKEFNKLAFEDNHQHRGIMFQDFLYDLFLTYDLHPRGAFSITGEQIDGAFEFENTQFLLEAKWEKDPIGAGPIDSFSRKIDRKLENTLGLFVSLSGFTSEGLSVIKGSKLAVILFDGSDLAIVLQGLVDLHDLLKRKITYAAQTGDPFLKL